ncbi:hypothetical protein DL89DRAFT_270513 [Linderina pennispora]|uniref:Peptidase A1 domain-containing protein n=1 Tax=Linderina pennispora TaxID=61395 RepID=A0A1Y1VXH2_9FUNG|nr:uncharacterized protein DL89DRAFT_270513 [Linderina pennispora]ORX65967.1 hypothetical protein DL89DRAFT_270513 [Linderina pennispora]
MVSRRFVSFLSAACMSSSLVLSLETKMPSYDLSQVKGGQLIKNGRPTYCAIAPIDNMSAYVSADCLEYVGGKIKTSVNYQVAVNDAYDGAQGKFNVSYVTVHPSYDPKTKANNIAILEFNLGQAETWSNRNAFYFPQWTSVVYAQRNVTNVESLTWDTHTAGANIYNSTECSTASPLFAENKYDLLCSTTIMKPNKSATCDMPYGVVYATVNDTYYQAGLFSHTAVYGGSDLCSYSKQYTYYTLLANYVMFAAITLNRTVYFTLPYNNMTPSVSGEYSMNVPKSVDVSGVTYVGGDFYARLSELGSSMSSASSPSGTETAGSSPTSSQGPSSESSANKSSGGTSNKTTIIIAVCASLGSVLLIVAAFFLYKWIRRINNERKWGPDEENAQLTMIANDLGGAEMPNAQNTSSLQQQQQQQQQQPQPPPSNIVHQSISQEELQQEIEQVQPEPDLPTYNDAISVANIINGKRR